MRLKKSKSDRVLLGVCGGIAKSLNIDSPLIRIGFVIGAIFTGSVLFWIYLALGIILSTDSE